MHGFRVFLTAGAVSAMTLLLWHSRAAAEPLEHYQPPLLAKAERALERGQPRRSLALLQGRVLELRPGAQRAAAHDLVCRAYFAQGDWQRAEPACDAAVEEGGGSAAWSFRNNRGVMRLLQGRTDAAIADFRAAARLQPRSRPVAKNLALAERAAAAQFSLR